MRTFKYVWVALVASLTFASASAFAQSATTPGSGVPAAAPSLCAVIDGKIAGEQASANQSTQSYQGYGDEGDDSGPTAQPAQEPKPQNPVSKVCADGKVHIIVGITPNDQNGYSDSHRHYGHFIMDRVPLTVVLDLDQSVQIDFTSLVTQKVIGFNGSDFLLAKQGPGEPPAISITGPVVKGNRKIYRIELIVQTMVPKPSAFNLDLRFAVDKTPDGKLPNWQTMTTPDFLVTTSDISDNGDQLLEGDLDMAAPRLPWMTVTALALGTFLVLFFPGLALVKRFNRVRPRKVIPADRLAWNVFEAQQADAIANGGYKRKHIRAIAHALRRYLGTLPQYPSIEALTVLEIENRFADDGKFASIKRALQMCEKDLYSDAALTVENPYESATALSAGDIEKLYEELDVLVPRPWDMK
ncbi:MAG: hypothetical protein JSS83_16990 [Cyanobacteria bacterium SZAS LIN-3]|nr:hypothetical protein [Cyanobacteria bacterium SZAS LIN-3]MBS2010733.1 hypothetical protein [Cyanobacteria bacterium SZAS TMP-1]